VAVPFVIALGFQHRKDPANTPVQVQEDEQDKDKENIHWNTNLPPDSFSFRF
jgi:hypothetical protein